MKSEVYSWRVSADLKSGLEREAQRRKTSVSAILDLAARDWLEKSDELLDAGDQQRHLREAALRCIGAFASGQTHRAERASQTVRQRLRRHYDR